MYFDPTTFTFSTDGDGRRMVTAVAAPAAAHDLLSAAHGDTLAAAVSRGSLVVGNATPKWSELVIGAADRFLGSDGTDASWTAPGALTKVDDTNVTATLGGTPATALLRAASITLGWTGTLAVARGGIGVGTLASNGVLYGNGVGAVLALAVNATATNKYLRQVSSGAPSWETIPASEIASGAALTKVDDTNVTLTLGGTPASALLVAASLTLGWTGTLAQARGGTGSGTPFANPTASVGLAAVNGVATTFMRSDAAPALSQSITPTWTGLHIWDTANIRVKGYLALGTVTTAPTNVTQGDLTAVREFVAQSVIGTGSTGVTPAVELAVVAATTARIHLQNNTSLYTLSDGFQLAISTADTYVWNFENGPMHFATNNSERLTIASGGQITASGVFDVGTGYRVANAAASGTFIRGNGTNGVFAAIVAGDLPANGANPTASLGLAAVNGSATTWMRSDGAPALSQSIAPTWTGTHQWSGALSIWVGAISPVSTGVVSMGNTISSASAHVSQLLIGSVFNGTGESSHAVMVSPSMAPTGNVVEATALAIWPAFSPASGITLSNAHLIQARVGTGSTVGGNAITNLDAWSVVVAYGTLKPTNATAIDVPNMGDTGVTKAVGINIAAQSGATNNYDIGFGTIDATGGAGAYAHRIPVLIAGVKEYLRTYAS